MILLCGCDMKKLTKLVGAKIGAPLNIYYGNSGIITIGLRHCIRRKGAIEWAHTLEHG